MQASPWLLNTRIPEWAELHTLFLLLPLLFLYLYPFFKVIWERVTRQDYLARAPGTLLQRWWE